MYRYLSIAAAAAMLLGLGGCGSSPSAPSGIAAATISIGPNGVSPSEVRIRAWSQVQFVNNDSRIHSMASDPLDQHSDCPPINFVGTLQPGESRNTGTLNLTRTCGFHDHLNETDQRLWGRITVVE
jgi:plastocyanin